jgi:hypothetical protein
VREQCLAVALVVERERLLDAAGSQSPRLVEAGDEDHVAVDVHHPQDAG